jgi:GTP-binding protein
MPWPQVAVAGRSNVGKSSLINFLLGRRALARTSGTPGRTQALNFFLVGEEFVLVDLPGYGYARAPIPAVARWSENVRHFVRESSSLRAVLLLLDVRRDPSEQDRDFAFWVRSAGRPLVPVVTKCDKVPRGRLKARLEQIGKAVRVEAAELVPTSVKARQGRDRLWDRVETLLEGEPVPEERSAEP